MHGWSTKRNHGRRLSSYCRPLSSHLRILLSADYRDDNGDDNGDDGGGGDDDNDNGGGGGGDDDHNDDFDYGDGDTTPLAIH